MSRSERIVRKRADGTVEWVHQDGDKYMVTGIDRSGRRFKRVFASWFYASGINLWHGSRWLLRDGQRHLISRV